MKNSYARIYRRSLQEPTTHSMQLQYIHVMAFLIDQFMLRLNFLQIQTPKKALLTDLKFAKYLWALRYELGILKGERMIEGCRFWWDADSGGPKLKFFGK